ncbi:MAG: hypothetical protein AAF402_16955, partial [Pseudomonadota bacterium]
MVQIIVIAEPDQPEPSSWGVGAERPTGWSHNGGNPIDIDVQKRASTWNLPWWHPGTAVQSLMTGEDQRPIKSERLLRTSNQNGAPEASNQIRVL